MREKVMVSWSGGKDSTLALHKVLESGQYEVASLLTTIAKEHDRISHHGVRRQLLELQAQALGIPLKMVFLSVQNNQPCRTDDTVVMSHYEQLMEEAMLEAKAEGIEKVVFGDIFLEDLRKYREDQLAKVGMTGLFPIWKEDTTDLYKRFVSLGYKAYLSCIDGNKLAESFVGRPLDLDLLTDLPASVDPCGENGEYHSFVWAGPRFKYSIPVERGEVVTRGNRFFVDLVLATAQPQGKGIAWQ